MILSPVLLLSSLLYYTLVSCEHKDAESLCASQQTCENCLRTPQCVWCSTKVSDQNATSSLVRCVTRKKFSKVGDLWCRRADVIDETNSMVVLENRSLSSMKEMVPVQIQPQRIKLKLRRGEEYRLTLKYSQAEDYPVDLYYLMDLSASMEVYRDRLSELGLHLAEAMRKLTANFRLGFGSFVDKVVQPMTSTQPKNLQSPCNLKNGKPCASPYGYKNQMPLTENVILFKDRVQEAPVSGNLDSPEGGLDAMMQAMVCTKEIGWRQNARHLIVFSTDSSSHIAGDGRLAGIIEPNDCLCHLDKNGFYTHSLLQDYPSIAQINRIAREHNMNIFFAVPKKYNATYQTLSKKIKGSSVGMLEQDSQNVVGLISGEYEKLVTSITITDDAPKIIDVKYFSRCLEENGEMKERRECGGLRVGNIVEFIVALQAVECPMNSNEWQQSIQIKPRGINESLTIDLSIICDCPCDRPGHPGYKVASKDCKGNGTLICGQCFCNDGFYGKQCECKRNEAKEVESAAVTADCKPNNETNEICSGHGDCKCGVCDCVKRPNPQELFYGKYCECDNFSCKRSSGLVCGGRGKCECGSCNCLPGWGGETCDCKATNTTCIPDNSETMEICSGRGDCVCGVCHCHEKNNIRYSGQYCEECPTCPGQQCEQLKSCVECTVYNSGPFAGNGKCDQCLHQIDIVKEIKEDPEKDQETDAHVCRIADDAGCMFAFKYEYYRGGTGGDIKIFKIFAEKEKTCPKPLNVIGVAVGLVISTVIIGFLILAAWKIVTTIQDEREYAKFERERALAKWDTGDNPLYKKATSSFSNPMFNDTDRN